ncbi:LytTR family DNA-binding domain-containing protein [Spirosoma agri]|jgi:DNA-binding LytR/AlgR family response regulator|uniref:LytTR family transcriptional regulator n=1 Tax=Spirosoma agri TaxID=1987381 RepID=A0A6M0IPV9_9BACT|nr:LytTR family DNA-binding domain-containing protein [Spirosoma agri]NEU69585.1 LytTR family transcriptional regulator [Spirosoma agri]
MDTIHLIGDSHPVRIDTIMWLEGEANYTRVHYQKGTFTLVTQPLHWFEQHLNFIRVHRSAIVNPIYVREFKQKRGRSGWVRMIDDTVVPVSRDRLENTAIQLTLIGNQKPPFDDK